MGKEQSLRLIEFKNQLDETLRAIFPPAEGDTAVFCLHGFERLSEEQKFTNIERQLRGKMPVLRLDHSGCGLSDGDFEDLTVEKLVGEVGSLMGELQAQFGRIDKIHLVAHSLGACVGLRYAVENPDKVDKLVFLSPAFNQQALLRYWFVSSTVREEEISWDNYQDYLEEKAFQEFAAREPKEMSEHYLGPEYHQENKDRDYQFLLEDIDPERILIVYGNEDESVPFESNDWLPNELRTIEVDSGDHDLEKPTMVEQYLDEVVKFLKQ
jgi:pimeloyl-ACP methyl ester carboxylesterase